MRRVTESKRFQRRIEQFDCEHCGASVQGDGYTNHCPKCLWSKHVDVNPGDRLAECKGLMEPMGVESKAGAFVILHRCQKCGFERRNKRQEMDDFEVLLSLAAMGVKGH
ncbi:MAG: RNHCP domain-containing protein [Oligoflexia bacterium]|nr:RNHCP domain-containing protein [Oligoflexia bacterium]